MYGFVDWMVVVFRNFFNSVFCTPRWTVGGAVAAGLGLHWAIIADRTMWVMGSRRLEIDRHFFEIHETSEFDVLLYSS